MQLSHSQDPLIHLYKSVKMFPNVVADNILIISPDYCCYSICRLTSGSGISHDGTIDQQTRGHTLILIIPISSAFSFSLFPKLILAFLALPRNSQCCSSRHFVGKVSSRPFIFIKYISFNFQGHLTHFYQ